MLQEHLRKPDRAQRPRQPRLKLAILTDDEFCAAASDVDDQNSRIRMRPASLHTQMNQSGFFQTRNNLDSGLPARWRRVPEIRPDCWHRAQHWWRRREPHRCSASSTHPREPSENGADVLDRFLTDRSGLEHARTDTRHFAVSRKGHPRRVRTTSAANMRTELLPMSTAAYLAM